jgi:hypothetical protein
VINESFKVVLPTQQHKLVAAERRDDFSAARLFISVFSLLTALMSQPRAKRYGRKTELKLDSEAV